MEIAWHEVPEQWKEEFDSLSRPETPDEDAFVQRFGRHIESVYTILRRYRSTRSVAYVNTAYTELYKLFSNIDAVISQQYKTQNPKLVVRDTAPKLLALRDCILTVPGEADYMLAPGCGLADILGQYDPSVKLDDQAFIDSFPATVDILNSKMLPRKLSIRSWQSRRSDFTDFTFLLKGVCVRLAK
jgi:FKBP12-rapamycin complex-associated protein